MTKTFLLRTAGALSLLLASTGLSQAATMNVTASLTPSSEVPASKSEGSGTLSGTYDPDTKKLEFTVDYKGLTGPATMAHIHAPAPTGKDGPIEVPIKGSVASPIKEDVTLTDDQAKNLTDGMSYFNVHTAANPGGEIRGQMLLEK